MFSLMEIEINEFDGTSGSADSCFHDGIWITNKRHDGAIMIGVPM